MRISRLCLLATFALFAGASLIVLRAGAQIPAPPGQPARPPLEPNSVTIVRTDESGSVVEEQVTGYTAANQPEATGVIYTPQRVTAANALNVPYAPGPYVPDQESQKLFQAEQAAAAEAKALTSHLRRETTSDEQVADAKAKLRQKLVEIFELQQKRREREVTQIEERLNKLKETMKKRNEAKDSIVDRRLEVLTGGVDELGWEETGRAPPGSTPYFRNYYSTPAYPPQPGAVIAPQPVPTAPAAGRRPRGPAAPAPSPTIPGGPPLSTPPPAPAPVDPALPEAPVSPAPSAPVVPRPAR